MGAFPPSIPTLGTWAQQTRQAKATRFLIHNILPADNLVLLSGVPKDAQKTFLAMWAALMVATGTSYDRLKCGKPKAVLYIYEEGDKPGTLARFDAIAKGLGIAPVDEISTLHFAHRLGFSLDSKEWVEYVRTLVEQHKVAFVVIDTLAKCMQSDENSVQAVGNAIRAAERLRSGECSVMFVHHTRKEDAKLSNGRHGTPEPDGDIRGSSALCGSYETHWAVRSYNTALNGDKEQYLIVGGKEFPMRASFYTFKFVNKQVEGPHGPEMLMDTVTLELSETHADLPYVEAKTPRAKKGE